MELAKKIANPLWMPHSVPQLMAMMSPASQIGYGGAAGGGKTDTMLGLSFLEHQRSLILRREATQLNGLVERSIEIIGSDKFFNGSKNIWKLPDGKRIRFGGLPKADDWMKYQGQPNDLLAFDEAANFLESQVRNLMAWNRSASGHHCRLFLGFNPPTTAEGQWIVAFFAPWLDDGHRKPAEPGEIRFFAMIDGKEQEFETDEPIEVKRGEHIRVIRPRSRTFIPARVEDNSFLMDTGYADTLEALPEPLRSMMRDGAFGAGLDDDVWQVIPTEWIKQAQARWTKQKPSDTPMTTLGVDPSRGGRDETVMSPKYGVRYFGEQVVIPGAGAPDGQTVAGLCIANGQKNTRYGVDVIGIGASVYDHLKDLVGDRVEELNGASTRRSEGKPDKSGRLEFKNDRAYDHWMLREALDPKSGLDLAIPPDRALAADLAAPRWKMSGGKIQIEEKADIKKRIGRSPDRGDALIDAHATTPVSVKPRSNTDRAEMAYEPEY